MMIEDEAVLRAKDKVVDIDMLQLSMALTNDTTDNHSSAYEYNNLRERPYNNRSEMTEMVEYYYFEISGEYGTGGRPYVKKIKNPYLEIDMVDPEEPILF